MAVKIHPSIFVHPGPWLRRTYVDHYGLDVTETAKRLGVTRPPMSNLLNGKAALSPEMAIRFEKAFGIKASILVRMQANYDIAQAEKFADKIKVERIPEPS
jgi:addiction module HigA family antidote